MRSLIFPSDGEKLQRGGWGVMVQFMNIYHKQDILDFMEFDITNLLNVLRSQFTFPQLKIFVETFAMQKFEWS